MQLQKTGNCMKNPTKISYKLSRNATTNIRKTVEKHNRKYQAMIEKDKCKIRSMTEKCNCIIWANGRETQLQIHVSGKWQRNATANTCFWQLKTSCQSKFQTIAREIQLQITWKFLRNATTYEPPHGKTNNVVSEQVRHNPTCTSTEKS